jgi:hypothetical protein
MAKFVTPDLRAFSPSLVIIIFQESNPRTSLIIFMEKNTPIKCIVERFLLLTFPRTAIANKKIAVLKHRQRHFLHYMELKHVNIIRTLCRHKWSQADGKRDFRADPSVKGRVTV